MTSLCLYDLFAFIVNVKGVLGISSSLLMCTTRRLVTDVDTGVTDTCTHNRWHFMNVTPSESQRAHN